jgi:rubrerythrin
MITGGTMDEKPKTTEQQKRLLKLFHKAIEEERAAQHLYRVLWELCDDPELKKVLEDLRGDEEEHEKQLLERYVEYRARFAPEDL